MDVGQGAGVEARALLTQGASRVLALSDTGEGGRGNRPRACVRARCDLLDPMVSRVLLQRLAGWRHPTPTLPYGLCLTRGVFKSLW